MVALGGMGELRVLKVLIERKGKNRIPNIRDNNLVSNNNFFDDSSYHLKTLRQQQNCKYNMHQFVTCIPMVMMRIYAGLWET